MDSGLADKGKPKANLTSELGRVGGGGESSSFTYLYILLSLSLIILVLLNTIKLHLHGMNSIIAL